NLADGRETRKLYYENKSDNEFGGISPPWLNDLEETYELAFPHQFGVLKFANNLTVPNHNVPSDAKSTCQNVSVVSFDQSRRLINHFGYESALNSTIHAMLDHPRARLFEFEGHWGEYEDYRFPKIRTEQFVSEGGYEDLSLEEFEKYDPVQNSQIRGMVRNPRVRLFREQTLTGTSLKYHSGMNGTGCNLKQVSELFRFKFNLDIVIPFKMIKRFD
ncbi:unnamed protein product, partial [Allacma fusca]